ncbi:hypothetical protein MTR67_002788 [Solanum verrucosum]|uniref:Uncharacterized protein n=1 Tax=Solanum verrucosum TaxID=315347 RepID=A0AAF0PQU6_SOLVR|nr:hypothetical protein MTR67_002788 [Solanum verrucosum]
MFDGLEQWSPQKRRVHQKLTGSVATSLTMNLSVNSRIYITKGCNTEKCMSHECTDKKTDIPCSLSDNHLFTNFVWGKSFSWKTLFALLSLIHPLGILDKKPKGFLLGEIDIDDGDLDTELELLTKMDEDELGFQQHRAHS